MIDIIKYKMELIKYTWNHKKAFLKVEKRLRGRNTLRGYLHDSEKIVMYIFLPKLVAHNIHVNRSHHHNKAKTTEDYINMVIDWECARMTKPDKPLNARQTLYKFYPQLINKIQPILQQFNL